MSENFTNVLTIIGQQKKAQAEASNTALNITTFKVGDGNGAYYEPSENQTALVNVKYTGTFATGTQSQIILNPSASNEVLYKCFIPADVGGFTIRELGLFDTDGNLILICKLPAQDKFALDSGLYQPLTFTPKIIYTNPQTQAVLTPTSQVIPTASQIINMISEYAPQTEFSVPLINNEGTVSLETDNSLTVLNNKLSVVTDNLIKTDGSNKATSLLEYATAVSAANDLDIPSYKNLKDYISNQNYLKKDGSINPTNLLTYAAAVSASADLDIPSFKNVKDYLSTGLTSINNSLGQKADSDLGNVTLFDVIDLGTITANFTLTQDRVHKGNITASCALNLPAVSTKFHNELFDFTLASGVSLTIPTNINWNYSVSPSLSNTLVNRFIFDTKDGGATWKGYYSQFAGTI